MLCRNFETPSPRNTSLPACLPVRLGKKYSKYHIISIFRWSLALVSMGPCGFGGWDRPVFTIYFLIWVFKVWMDGPRRACVSKRVSQCECGGVSICVRLCRQQSVDNLSGILLGRALQALAFIR